ncbi:MAG: hypothetical protein M1839_003183 [Geoglossum umbratile]|nr:MAG: hypothetical protein M1839_003183 [Geoglossum umbratile]
MEVTSVHGGPKTDSSPSIYHPSERTSPMQQKFEAATKANYKPSTKIPYKPSLWFFYGTLMDPEILQSVLGLPELPVLQKGRIHGFKIRMWGVYPTLVPCDGCEVEGMIYKIESVLQFVRLEGYETSAYRWCFCTIEMDDGTRVEYGRTFRWAGDLDSKELEDGEFDLSRYQKFFKPSMVKEMMERIKEL